MNTLLIIPCYNEEKSIVRIIKKLQQYPEYDYIVVNDGSTDNTLNVLKENHINYISLSVNMGLAAAFQTGVLYASCSSKHYDAVCQFDADGQHLPEYLDSMSRVIEKEGIDVVIGSRFKEDSDYKEGFSKSFSRRIISVCIWLFTKCRLSDPTSGMRMYKDTVYPFFLLDKNLTPEPDGLVWFLRKGFKIREVQVNMEERIEGESYLTFTRAIKYMIHVISSILLVSWWRK